ncbi:MAG: LuxR C-terminal-related transcriptional regulator [Vulcanimicrobiaceae bacterium]
MADPTTRATEAGRQEPDATSSVDVLRRRAVPALYAVDAELRVHFACGVPPGPGMDRLPVRVERIVRILVDANHGEIDCPLGVDGDLVVRIVELYSRTAELKGIIVEKLRRRDPLQEAIVRFGITTRETQVLRLLLLGASTATIAKQLHIAETTAVDHVRRIAVKTSSRGRGQIVARVLGFL